ncbi:MAG: hypothetical protein K2Y21_00230 [Phycisphaerales bacterium]|nr:hypothetical protein [Phycisphaerales bacterium]
MKWSLFSGVGTVGMVIAASGGPLAPLASADPTPNIVIDSFEFLPIFQNQGFVITTAVNANGDFCGYYGGFIFQEFRYFQNAPYNGGFDVTLNGMNDLGVCVGGSFQKFPPFGIRGQNRSPFDIFTRLALYDINNRGWMVGRSFPASGIEVDVRLDENGTTELPPDARWRLIDEEGRVWGSDFFSGPESVVFKTRFGSPVNLGSFGGAGARVTFVNSKGDWCGYRYFSDPDAPSEGLAVVGGIERFIASETGNSSRALAVTLDGQIIGSDRGLCSPECDGKVWVIKNGVRHNLDDEIGAFLGFVPTLFDADAASETGWIVGYAEDPRDNTGHIFRMKIQVDIDTDGDGLLDRWESENGGIDVNRDGVIDFKPYDLGARPDHKDLFVEVDAGTIPLADAEVSKLLLAFDNAPVTNPDNTTGIHLHIVRDETNVLLPNAISFGDFPEGFKASKQAHFGTVAERGDSNAANILKAKAKVFRYCLIYDGIQFLANATPFNGIGEIGGNDFVVDFAAAIFNDGFRDSDDRAATFMHEFGHTLGLYHGGRTDTPAGASFQGKPNYPSIMNYALAHPMRWSSRFWTLDYSREELAPMLEQSLDEAGGIASSQYRNYSMPYGVGPDLARGMRLVKLDGRPTDFNANGRIASSAADLNFLPPAAGIAGTTGPSPGQTLNGHNDWAKLKYRIVLDADESAHDISIATGCPSSEAIAFLDQNILPPCDADFNGDGLVDDLDFQIFVVAYDELVCDIIDPGGGGARSTVGAGGTLPDCPCDLDNDRFVDDLDFQLFVLAYNEVLCP